MKQNSKLLFLLPLFGLALGMGFTSTNVTAQENSTSLLEFPQLVKNFINTDLDLNQKREIANILKQNKNQIEISAQKAINSRRNLAKELLSENTISENTAQELFRQASADTEKVFLQKVKVSNSIKQVLNTEQKKKINNMGLNFMAKADERMQNKKASLESWIQENSI